MNDITLLIPAKFKKRSLSIMLEVLKKFNCKKWIILKKMILSLLNPLANLKNIFYIRGNS